jgi:hypothetical protein
MDRPRFAPVARKAGSSRIGKQESSFCELATAKAPRRKEAKKLHPFGASLSKETRHPESFAKDPGFSASPHATQRFLLPLRGLVSRNKKSTSPRINSLDAQPPFK